MIKLKYELKLGKTLWRYHHDLIPSTQILAREQIYEVKQDSLYLWTANDQSQGIGQGNRSWTTPSGSNVNATYGFLLQAHEAALAKFIPYIAGLSVIEVLAKYNLRGKIKWVNDVLINKKKICGILSENRGKDQSIGLYRILVGIGINVNSTISDFIDLENKATSMKIETSVSYNIEDIILELSNIFAFNIQSLLNDNSLIEKINYNLEKFDGQIITFDTEYNGYHKGFIQGIDNNGALILLLDGQVKSFLNGRILP